MPPGWFGRQFACCLLLQGQQENLPLLQASFCVCLFFFFLVIVCLFVFFLTLNSWDFCPNFPYTILLSLIYFPNLVLLHLLLVSVMVLRLRLGIISCDASVLTMCSPIPTNEVLAFYLKRASYSVFFFLFCSLFNEIVPLQSSPFSLLTTFPTVSAPDLVLSRAG